MAAAKVRVAARGRKGGEREAARRGEPSYAPRGPGREGAAVEARATRRQAAAVFPLSPQGEGMTGGSPCQGFLLFPFFRKTSSL